MTRRDRDVLLAFALLSSLFLFAETAGILGHVLLYGAPLLLIALPLVAGRYFGEEHLARATARRRAERPRAARRIALPAGAVRTLAVLPRGGRLIAASLANRPPPALGPLS